jgi:hypothetical protein
MWITLSSSDLKNKLSASEYTSVTTAQVQEGKTAEEVVVEELGSTVAMVRGYVGAQQSNVLGEGVTIPDELKDAALVVMRHKVFSRLPGLKRLLDEARVREYEDAFTLFRDVAAGRFAVVPPEVPSEDQAVGQTVQVVSSRERQHTREKWSGVL